MAIMIDWAKTFVPGKILRRKGQVIYRGEETGKILTMPERCSHRGASMTHGTVEGDCIRCGYHARLQAPSAAAAPTVFEHKGIVWSSRYEIECPQAPREWDDPSFATFEYTRRVETAADVMMENLLDWEHVNSVHAFALERGDPDIVMWGDEFHGYAKYEYEGGLVLENEFWVPYTNVLRFIKGQSVFLLWTSITPRDNGGIDLHFRVSRNSLKWIPEAAFRLMNDFVLDEDRRIVRMIPPQYRGTLSDADGFISMYRQAVDVFKF